VFDADSSDFILSPVVNVINIVVSLLDSFNSGLSDFSEFSLGDSFPGDFLRDLHSLSIEKIADLRFTAQVVGLDDHFGRSVIILASS